MATDDWKHQGGPRRSRVPAPPKGKSRGRLAIAVFPLLLAAGAAVGLIFYFQGEPAPAFLSLPVDEYQEWPENAWARADATALKGAIPNGVGDVASESQERIEQFDSELKNLGGRTRGKRSTPVVIHLCALATVNGGSVYVLPAKAAADQRDKWLPLARVLEAVGNIDGHRLLLLDLRPVIDLRFGPAGNDLSRTLDKELKAAESGGLAFLVAAHCAPAVYPYVSPDLQRGVFAEFLRRGLAGHADGAVPGKDKDRKVSAVELVTYARGRVVQWQKFHGVPVAAPVLYGAATVADFDIQAVPPGTLPWDLVEGPLPEPAKVTEGWKAVEAWQKGEAAHTAPRTFRELQEMVARADRRAGGGRDRDRAESDLAAYLTRADDQRKTFTPTPFPVPTVGRAAHAQVPKADEIKAALEPLARALRAVKSEKEPVAKDEPKAKNELPDLQKGLWDKPPEPAPYPLTVVTLYNLLAAPNAPDREPDQLAAFLATIRGMKPTPTHVELGYLALMADDKIHNRKFWPKSLPKVVLAAGLASEEAADLSGRGLGRVKDRLGATDVKFRTSLRDLFRKESGLWDDARDRLAGLPREYQGIGELGTAYAAAVGEWEEDVAILPLIGDVAPIDPSAQKVFDTAFEALATATLAVRQAIDQPTETEGLNSARAEAADARRALVRLCRDVPNKATPVELRARLTLPVWTPAERVTLAARADAAAKDLANEVLKTESPSAEKADQVGQRLTDDAGFDAGAARRERRATLLLRTAGLRESAGPGDWRDALVGRPLQKYAAEPTPAAREKFAWLIHPFDLAAAPPTGTDRHDPGALRRRQVDKEAAEWLAGQRYGPLAAAMKEAADYQVSREKDPATPRDVATDLSAAADALTGWKP